MNSRTTEVIKQDTKSCMFSWPDRIIISETRKTASLNAHWIMIILLEVLTEVIATVCNHNQHLLLFADF